MPALCRIVDHDEKSCQYQARKAGAPRFLAEQGDVTTPVGKQ